MSTISEFQNFKYIDTQVGLDVNDKESQPTIEKDFVSTVIDIVTTNAAKNEFDGIDEQLKSLKREFLSDFSTETLSKLVQQIKDIDSLKEKLPTIYSHLIVDFDFRTKKAMKTSMFSTFNEEFRIACAKIDIERNANDFSINIQKYGIYSQKSLVELAKFVAQMNGCAICEHIENYGIESEEDRIAIAKIAAEHDGRAVSTYIKNFDIKSEEARIEIAKIAAANDGEGLSDFIEEYDIESQEALIEIAKIAAAQNGDGVSEFIQNYNIESVEARIAIAKIAAKQRGWGVSNLIKNYKISDQRELIAIAKIAAQQSGWSISQFILNYGIENEETRIEIAKIAAVESGEKTSEFIKNYRILNQGARIAIAKIAAQHCEKRFSQHIKNYSIDSEEERIAIAKIAAQKNGNNVSKYIRNYKITSEAARIAIAKLAVYQNPDRLSEYFQNYNITNEDERFEIAKIAAQGGVGLFSVYIGNYKISSEERRIVLAKMAAQKSGLAISVGIANYRILNEKVRFDIACIAAKENFEATFKKLDNFKLSTESRVNFFIHTHHFAPEAIQDINKLLPEKATALSLCPELRLFGLNDDFNIAQFLFDFSEFNQAPIHLIIRLHTEHSKLTQEKDLVVKAMKIRWLTFYCCVLDFAKESKPLLKDLTAIIDQLEHEPNAYVKDQKIQWISSLMMQCRLKKIENSAFHNQLDLFKTILDLRDPQLRSTLSKYFVNVLSSPILLKQINANAPEALVAMTLGSLVGKIEPYVKSNSTVSIPFNQRMKEVISQKYFRRNVEHMKSLLRSLDSLMETTKLTDLEKANILRNLIFVNTGLIGEKQSQQVLSSAQIVAQLIKCGQCDLLNRINSPQQLKEQVKDIFSSALHLDVPGFNDKFFKTFGSESDGWRNSGAFLTYISTIQTLPKEEKDQILLLLKTFAQSVLNNTFTDTRYDVSSSEHFKKLHVEAPDLLKEWKKGSQTAHESYVVMDTDHPCDLLLCGTEVGSCQKVDGDPNFSKALPAYLLDGKIRMMAIKNKNGVIVARCMLSLLWNQDTDKFVLFKEFNYPLGINVTFSDMLDKACIARAKQLGVPLLTKEKTTSEEGITTLQAFKGRAPFEYVDALGGIKTNAGYTIEGCSTIPT